MPTLTAIRVNPWLRAHYFSVTNDEVGIRELLGQLKPTEFVILEAIRSNPVIKNFYTQLRARGKYPKSALTACMRKLLVILNAMLHNKTHWKHLRPPF